MTLYAVEQCKKNGEPYKRRRIVHGICGPLLWIRGYKNRLAKSHPTWRLQIVELHVALACSGGCAA